MRNLLSYKLLRLRLAAILLVGCGLFSGSSGAGVLAYYSFDSDFTDGSGNGNHLSIGGGTPVISAATGEQLVGGGALDLDKAANEYLSLSSTIHFNATDSWSVSFWARRRPGAGIATGMVLGDNSTTDSFVWLPDNSSQVQGMRFRPAGVGTSDNNDYATGHDTDFHHWVLVADGTGSLRAYRDNVDLGTRFPSGGTDFDINSIGSGYTGTSQLFDGQIDELYIYDEAIDASAVDVLFNAGNTTDPDETPPTLASADIVDNANGGPVGVNTEVVYTISFSEDMDAATVGSEDFGNAGTATIEIGSITETSPGVFTVSVTPINTGTLQFSLVQGASLTDVAGNALDTASAIFDDTTLTVETAVTPPTITKLHVFLLGGQSNADGRAAPSGLPTSPVNLQEAQADVSLYEAGSLINLVPVGTEFGPEITMGRRLADSLGTERGTRVAIIKYAVGGTSLHVDWAPGGDASTTGDGPRYVTFQNTVSNGLSALAAAYPEASMTIKGMLWVQGERDVVAGFEDFYESNLTHFIADVRATYGADLPFILARLSTRQTALAAAPLAVVRTAQTNVAAADTLSRLIDTDSFGMKSDNLHFDADGQQDIGHAAAFQLLDSFPFTTSPTILFVGGNDYEITLEHAFPDFRYTLFSNPDLAPENWTLESEITASTSSLKYNIQLSTEQPRGFYRIQRTLPTP